MTQTGSARFEGDSWDLASSVGLTATMVAAARAVAGRAPGALVNDQFAEPLVRAVGVDFFVRMASGELDPDELAEDEANGLRRFADAMAFALTTSTTSFWMPPEPGFGRPSSWLPAWIPAPTGCAGQPAPSSSKSISRR